MDDIKKLNEDFNKASKTTVRGGLLAKLNHNNKYGTAGFNLYDYLFKNKVNKQGEPVTDDKLAVFGRLRDQYKEIKDKAEKERALYDSKSKQEKRESREEYSRRQTEITKQFQEDRTKAEIASILEENQRQQKTRSEEAMARRKAQQKMSGGYGAGPVVSYGGGEVVSMGVRDIESGDVSFEELERRGDVVTSLLRDIFLGGVKSSTVNMPVVDRGIAIAVELAIKGGSIALGGLANMAKQGVITAADVASDTAIGVAGAINSAYATYRKSQDYQPPKEDTFLLEGADLEAQKFKEADEDARKRPRTETGDTDPDTEVDVGIEEVEEGIEESKGLEPSDTQPSAKLPLEPVDTPPGALDPSPQPSPPISPSTPPAEESSAFDEEPLEPVSGGGDFPVIGKEDVSFDYGGVYVVDGDGDIVDIGGEYDDGSETRPDVETEDKKTIAEGALAPIQTEGGETAAEGADGRDDLLEPDEAKTLLREDFRWVQGDTNYFKRSQRGKLGYGSTTDVQRIEPFGISVSKLPEETKGDSVFKQSDERFEPFRGLHEIVRDGIREGMKAPQEDDEIKTSAQKPFAKVGGQIIWIPYYERVARFYFTSEDYSELVSHVVDTGGELKLKAPPQEVVVKMKTTIDSVREALSVYGLQRVKLKHDGMHTQYAEWLELKQIMKALGKYQKTTTGEYNQAGLFSGNLREAVSRAIDEAVGKVGEKRKRQLGRGLEGSKRVKTTDKSDDSPASFQPYNPFMVRDEAPRQVNVALPQFI